MCEGEYEFLKAIHAVSASFVPKQYAWGKYEQDEPETFLLLAELRDVGEQVCLPFFHVLSKLRGSVLRMSGRFFPFIFQVISQKSYSTLLAA